MADYSVLSEAQEFELQFRRFAAGLRVCLPGIIESFDAARQRVRAVPAVRMKSVAGNDVRYIGLPVIEDIPIVLPSAGDFAVTLPVKAGDLCLLVFADRDIGNFLASGRTENPGDSVSDETTAPRAHHLTDAVCIPGMFPEPKALEDYAADALELRDRAGNHRVRVTSDGIEIKTSGKLKIDASNVRLNDGMILTGGTFEDSGGRDSTAHTHDYTWTDPAGAGTTEGANG